MNECIVRSISVTAPYRQHILQCLSHVLRTPAISMNDNWVQEESEKIRYESHMQLGIDTCKQTGRTSIQCLSHRLHDVCDQTLRHVQCFF